MGSNTPWEDRSAGFYNDLDVIRRIASEPLPLEQVQCPTLIVHGTADNDVPYSNSQQAAKRICDATLYTIEGAHHLLWLSDQAPAMIRTQTDFLKAQL